MKKTMKSEYMLFYQSCIISMEISFFIRFPFTGYCMCVCVFVSISLSIPSARCRSPPLQKKEIKMMPVDWICFFLSAFSKMQSSKRFVTLKLGIFMVRAEEQNIKKKSGKKETSDGRYGNQYMLIFTNAAAKFRVNLKERENEKGPKNTFYIKCKLFAIGKWCTAASIFARIHFTHAMPHIQHTHNATIHFGSKTIICNIIVYYPDAAVGGCCHGPPEFRHIYFG